MRILDDLVDQTATTVERLVVDVIEVEVLLLVDGYELGPTRDGRDSGADRGCDDLVARGCRNVEDPFPIVVPLTRDIAVLAANRQRGDCGANGNSRGRSRFRPTELPPIVIQMASEWITGTALIESISGKLSEQERALLTLLGRYLLELHSRDTAAVVAATTVVI